VPYLAFCGLLWAFWGFLGPFRLPWGLEGGAGGGDLRRYAIHLRPAAFRYSRPGRVHTSQFHSVWQPHCFVAGGDAVVAVFAGAAFLGLNLEALTAQLARSRNAHSRESNRELHSKTIYFAV
jgi:hypothetical protein